MLSQKFMLHLGGCALFAIISMVCISGDNLTTNRQLNPNLVSTPQVVRGRNSTKPKFVLHVGLPKTGTTYLQCSMCQKSMAGLLKSDRIRYIGTCPPECGRKSQRASRDMVKHSAAAIFDHKETWDSNVDHLGPVLQNGSIGEIRRLPEFRANFKRGIKKIAKAGYGGVFIFEGCHIFNANHIQAMAELLSPIFDVQVVIVYRRLYDWLPSKYNSISKKSRNRQAYSEWPSNGGKNLLSFDLDGRDEFSSYVGRLEQSGQHPADTAQQNYQQFFENVKVVNLHDVQADSFEHFLCKVIPMALTACKAHASGSLAGSRQQNPSRPFHYDQIAVAAYNRGFWEQEMTRQKATQLVYQYLKDKNVSEFPKTCLSIETSNRLHNLSLAMEERLFGQSADFNATRFCSVDVNAVLTDQSWKSVLALSGD